MKKVFLYAFLAITLVSCGGLAKQFVTFTSDQPLQEGKSRIYVMFCNYSMSSTPIISLFCDENLIGTIDRDGYLAFDVPSGEKYSLEATTGRREGYTWNGNAGEDHFTINAKDGKSYYLKLSFGKRGKIGAYTFDYISKEEGERLIKRSPKPKLNYIEEDE